MENKICWEGKAHNSISFGSDLERAFLHSAANGHFRAHFDKCRSRPGSPPTRCFITHPTDELVDRSSIHIFLTRFGDAG